MQLSGLAQLIVITTQASLDLETSINSVANSAPHNLTVLIQTCSKGPVMESNLCSCNESSFVEHGYILGQSGVPFLIAACTCLDKRLISSAYCGLYESLLVYITVLREESCSGGVGRL